MHHSVVSPPLKAATILFMSAAAFSGCGKGRVDVPEEHACASAPCGEHGICDETADGFVCHCDPPYAGVRCGSCAAGYQDNDGNGTCVRTCATAGWTCSDHGACSDASGGPVCTCASGYQDNDHTGTCLPTCAATALSCSSGACSDASGAATCVCSEGYTGRFCDTCAVGFQDYDGDGVCRPTCATAGLTCPQHTECSAISGAASCYCEGGYVLSNGACVLAAGATCATAASLPLAQSYLPVNNIGAGGDYVGTCGGQGEEVVYTFTVTGPLDMSFYATGFDTVLYLRRGSCTGIEVACNDDAGAGDTGSFLEARISNTDTITYYLFADVYGSERGDFFLYPTFSCAAGTVFDPSQARCVDDPCDPNPCTGAHAHTCTPALPSYTCGCDRRYVPGSTPGECVADPSPQGDTCADAAVLDVASGWGFFDDSTSDAGFDAEGSCGGIGPDRVYRFTLAERSFAWFFVTGFDAVLHLRRDCDVSGGELACVDGMGDYEYLELVLDPGTYYLWVDSFETTGGDFTLKYFFSPDPCNVPVCPSDATCLSTRYYTDYRCDCPPGALLLGNLCLDDPCEPNPCMASHRSVCVRQLPERYVCRCDPGYVEVDGACVASASAPDWVVLVYMNGDNDLSAFGYEDLAEMVAAGASDRVQVVVLFDSYDGDASIVRVGSAGTQQVLASWGEIDMSDWKVLRDFGVFGVRSFPARHYALVLWNHGGGWRAPARKKANKGFSNDFHGMYDELLITGGDYEAALEAITHELGTKLDLVGFDACLMSMWEVAAATEGYARVFVGSEEIEPGSGWRYDELLAALVQNPGMSAVDLGRAIAVTYGAQSPAHATMAVTDLSQLSGVTEAVSRLADALMASSAQYAQIEAVRDDTRGFDEPSSIDLRHFAQGLAVMAGASSELVAAAGQVQAAVQRAVVHREVGDAYANAYGLAIYLPSSVDGWFHPAYRDVGAVWSRATHWDEFVEDFVSP